MPMEEQVDVVICGGGSAGLMCALWLARNGISYVILERRGGPMIHGQADGVQCRTVEIFESFGLSEVLLKEAYHAFEHTFWASDGDGELRRTDCTADTPPNLSHLPHAILSQARVNSLLIEKIQRASGKTQILYNTEVLGVEVDESLDSPAAYAVTTTTKAEGQVKKFCSKYVLVSPKIIYALIKIG